ncbi:protein translocase subunit SecF [Pseudomonadota bacterium]
MEIIKKGFKFDFLGRRRIALIVSLAVITISIASLAVRGLNFGLDFTGGTLVEVSYSDPIEVAHVRTTLKVAGIEDAIVQHFGTARDVMVRLPANQEKNTAALSTQVMEALRKPLDERLSGTSVGDQQTCRAGSSSEVTSCKVQMRRVEFVGPQVGQELTEQGTMAMIYALIGILIYVAWRFEWRFAVGSVVALVHDVIITVGIFSLLGLEFSLPVLAAVLAVIGYSLNDTIVVFDRIRENFRKMRRGNTIEIMNTSINQTLRRTVLTSITTLLVVLTLFFLGGEVIHGFSAALMIGIVVGTYSSIYVASPVVLGLGISREDLAVVKKEGAELDALP